MEEIAKLNVWDGADSPFPAGEFKVYISSLAPEPPQLSVLQGGVHLTFSIETGEQIGGDAEEQQTSTAAYIVANIKRWLNSAHVCFPQITNCESALLTWVQLHD